MTVCIIGAGASGCICAYFLIKAGIEVTLFDYGTPLRTLLPTGGGRCNLAHAEYDFKELAKNYPRGEKFLYSVFSKFATFETLDMFKEIGINTYTQDDNRIFPISNSSKDVREKILKAIRNANFVKEKVNDIIPIENGYKIITTNAEYFFSNVIISTGGKDKYFDKLNHTIIAPKPSLVGLNCAVGELSGVVLKNVYSKDLKIFGDILFTHYGVSGPLVYKISSIKARDTFPYELTFDLHPEKTDLQTILNSNPHKELKNVLSQMLPHRFAEYISGEYARTEACNIDGKTRDIISNKIKNFKLTVTGTNKGEETVTSGGYKLNEINSKSMESKINPNLYIIGEALDIDGFCGGFNLQNAWSTAFIASNDIMRKLN